MGPAVGWAKSLLIVAAWARRARDFAHADKPSNARLCPPYAPAALPPSDVLAAVDVDLGAVHIGRRVRAEHIDDLGDFVGRAEAMHWNLVGHDIGGPRRENRRVDLARSNGIDANAERTEVARHLAGERGKRRLRRGVCRAGERMHARSRNGSDVND